MNNYDKAVQRNEKEYQKLLDTALWVKEHGLCNVPCVEMSIYDNYALAIIAPNDFDAFKNIRRQMGNGWKRTYQHKNNKGNRWIMFRRKNEESSYCNRTFGILIDADLAAQSCKLVKVGERIEEIYEVVCE